MVTNPTELQFEVLAALQPVVEQNLELLLKVDAAWQPADVLPDFSTNDWPAAVERLQAGAAGVSEDLLAVLVGNMVTEEALPTYAISLNRIVRDPDGDAPTPWARWMRGWIGEENRHGDLMNGYLRLSGRVNMRAVETTIHHLLVNGFSARTGLDPYAGLIYTAYQERATTVGHANVGRMAAQQGDDVLAAVCKRVAADESRHEQFYTRIVREIVDRDPGTAILMFRKMMKRTMPMPGQNMADGQGPDLYARYAALAQRLGVYTAADYATNIGYLVRSWRIAERSVSGHAAKAQEFLCVQAERLQELAEMVTSAARERELPPFAWILPGRVAVGEPREG